MNENVHENGNGNVNENENVNVNKCVNEHERVNVKKKYIYGRANESLSESVKRERTKT